MSCWPVFFNCKLHDRIGSSLLKELYLWIIALISLLSITLSISLLQEFTFGQLIHQLSICPHPETAAHQAQVCCGFTRKDCSASSPQWTAVAKTQPLALQMCSSQGRARRFLLLASQITTSQLKIVSVLLFILFQPLLSPGPSLKHLKQQL